MGERGNRFLRICDRILGIPLSFATALLRCFEEQKPTNKPKRVGFLCLGAIGDLLLLTACITALKKKWPKASFFLITTKANAQTCPCIPCIDESRSFSLRELPALIVYLRAQQLDILFDATQWARLGTIVSNCSGAHVTVGFSTPGQYRSKGYTYRVPHLASVHECSNFLALGRPFFPDLHGEPTILVPQERPKNLTCSAVFSAQYPVFFHMWPSGVHAQYKEWPEEYWVCLAKSLAEQGCSIFFTGSAYDQNRTESFLARNSLPNAHSIAGKVTLEELAWLFAHAYCVISVNTGIMHLAALTGCPTIALHGPTNPLRWGPWGKNTVSLLPNNKDVAYLHLGFEYKGHENTPCMQDLPVSFVLDACKKMHLLPKP